MQTAAEGPQAAAGVITQLRQEKSRLTERDNLALQERTAVMDKINALLQTINQSSGEQRAAIASLAASAAAVMDQASQQFADTLGAQAGQSAEVTAQVAGSAVELASLGESFNHGVQLFNASNEKLMESLQRMEGAMHQSMARSDEQLAYYVAQAREVIDLSITSQQGIVEDLRQLHTRQALLSEGVAG
jgi:methyl-accepting chemotaxis protein